jgi:hypothetical protein
MIDFELTYIGSGVCTAYAQTDAYVCMMSLFSKILSATLIVSCASRISFSHYELLVQYSREGDSLYYCCVSRWC